MDRENIKVYASSYKEAWVKGLHYADKARETGNGAYNHLASSYKALAEKMKGR